MKSVACVGLFREPHTLPRGPTLATTDLKADKCFRADLREGKNSNLRPTIFLTMLRRISMMCANTFV
jgi:hypothetical protein